jgi:hypothetical protein
MLLPGRPCAAAADEKVFEDCIALTALQGSAATPACDRTVEVDLIALHPNDLIMRLAGGAVEEVG